MRVLRTTNVEHVDDWRPWRWVELATDWTICYWYRLNIAANKLSTLTNTVYIGSGSVLVTGEVVVKQTWHGLVVADGDQISVLWRRSEHVAAVRWHVSASRQECSYSSPVYWRWMRGQWILNANEFWSHNKNRSRWPTLLSFRSSSTVAKFAMDEQVQRTSETSDTTDSHL